MKIVLLAVPFLFPGSPSLGLTQLKSRISKIFAEEIEVRIVYANHDFFQYFGSKLYEKIRKCGLTMLLNEWIFRHEAFDLTKPNYEEYFKRFFPKNTANSSEMIVLKEKLNNLGAFIQR